METSLLSSTLLFTNFISHHGSFFLCFIIIYYCLKACKIKIILSLINASQVQKGFISISPVLSHWFSPLMTFVFCVAWHQVMHEYVALENFWKRYNKVLLEKLALDKEKQTLMAENGQLRTLLKQYLDGISVNDEILSQVNPLFVVNHKTNVKWVLRILFIKQFTSRKISVKFYIEHYYLLRFNLIIALIIKIWIFEVKINYHYLTRFWFLKFSINTYNSPIA